MPASFQHLRVRLRIEQTRLLNWGQKIGLVEEMLSEPSRSLEQNRSLIIDILLEVQALFKACIVIETKHDRYLPQRWTKTPKDAPDSATFDQRFPQATNSFLQKTLRVLDKASEVPDRLLWSMVRKDKFENLVQRLIDYNSSIEALLDSTSIVQLQHMQQQTFMALLQLNSSVAELKEVSGALQIKAGVTTTTPAVLDQRKEKPEGNNDHISGSGVEIARLADFKAQQIHIESQSSQALHIEPLDPERIIFGNLAGTRSVAEYQGSTVWIEWKYSDIDLGLHPRWRAMIEDRIKKLVILLKPPNNPPGFNALQCLGYFYDDSEDCFGFVYSRPPHAAAHAVPASLLEIIKAHRSHCDDLQPLPSLTKRIQLAHSIARSLMYIHSVNWIHKGLRSDNIVFFLQATQDDSSGHKHDDNSYLDPDLLRQAPLIAGFEYARPDMPEEATEPPPEHSEWDMYRRASSTAQLRHQRRLARSQKSDDIYSLGIVLVEIAYWRPINEIVELSSSLSSSSSSSVGRDVRQVLLQASHLAVITGSLGEAYAAVVKTCLTGGEALSIPANASESDVHVGVRLQETFVREVVNKLGAIRV